MARLKWGRQAKAKAEGYAGGAVALGYEVRDGKLVVNEGQALAVGRSAGLRRDGIGYRAIPRRLAEEGFHTKRGGEWRPGTVRTLRTPHRFGRTSPTVGRRGASTTR